MNYRFQLFTRKMFEQRFFFLNVTISYQFNIPSQYLVRSKHTPSFRHLNLSFPHGAFGQFISSSPFEQSEKPSQTYDFEIQRPLSQAN